MNITSFLHVGVTSKNPKRFEEFYSKHFGFERTRTVRLNDNKELIFIKNKDNFCFEIFPADEESLLPPPKADGYKFPGWRHIAFQVDDVDAKIAEMGNDAVISMGTIMLDKHIKGWKAAWIKDPEGNIIEICQGYKH